MFIFTTLLGLHIVYMRTKFDHYRVSRLKDMVDAHQNLSGSLDLTISGVICHPRQPIYQI